MAACHINVLPTELLQSIFIEFWRSESGSPTELLSVCRHWEAIALNTKLLWTKIRFGVDNRKNPSPSYVTCVNADELFHRLLSIEGMKFDFCAAVVSRRSLKDSLCHSTRSQFRNCRSFQVTRHSTNKVLRLLTDVSSLEELKLEYVDYDEVHRLFERLDKPEARLKSLHFEGYLSGDWWQFNTMFSRLQELSLTNYSIQPKWAGQRLFNSLKALNKLEFNNSGGFYNFRDVFEERLDVASPTLQTLLISGAWHSLEEIVAPNLDILALEYGNYNSDLGLMFLAATQLRPRIICAQELNQTGLFLFIIDTFGDTALEIRLGSSVGPPLDIVRSRMEKMTNMGKIVRWNGIILP
ncbi:9041_t:CDS:2 [Acaulospora colombiana]|uniref:9041_t:CDS:1 n=1 Tax=Acaulospora colombiana TaxID=27376 RepID=A0ACA9NRC9_9GLOM|nr:9041_t:CDS:2 [Acaulospora colombiana]